MANGLGDIWASINWCLHRSILLKSPIQFSNTPALWYPDKWIKERVYEVIPLFDSKGQIIVTNEKSDSKVDGEAIWKFPYHPTKEQWKKTDNRLIAVHFTPHSLIKYTPTDTIKSDFVNTIKGFGFDVVELSHGLSLVHVVNILANCSACVSMCSGFSHIAHSVGTPLHLIQNGIDAKYVNKHHVNKAYILHETFADAAEFIGENDE